MKPNKKSEFIVNIIGLLCIYIVLGTIYHFVLGHDLSSTIRLLATQTFLLLIVGLPIAVILFLIFMLGKKKR